MDLHSFGTISMRIGRIYNRAASSNLTWCKLVVFVVISLVVEADSDMRFFVSFKLATADICSVVLVLEY